MNISPKKYWTQFFFKIVQYFHDETRLLGHPQPQMYPPVALNQHTWINRTHKHFVYMFQHVQGPMNILK